MGWLAHWLYWHTGTNGSGPWYGFFSGFGSDIGEVAIVGGLVSMVRQHNCEVRGCPRLGRHRTAAGHRVCRRHHPDDHLTAQRVRSDHEAAKGME